jgi:hypothetical protein
MNADGTGSTKLTDFPSTEGDCSVSADGAFIVFMSGPTMNSEVYRMNADGQNWVNLTNNEAVDGHPSISWGAVPAARPTSAGDETAPATNPTNTGDVPAAAVIAGKTYTLFDYKRFQDDEPNSASGELFWLKGKIQQIIGSSVFIVDVSKTGNPYQPVWINCDRLITSDVASAATGDIVWIYGVMEYDILADSYKQDGKPVIPKINAEYIYKTELGK